MQIVNPKYSFVKFDSPEAVNNCCNGDQEFCIPVIEETDTYFQVKLTSAVYSEIQDMMDDDSESSDSAFHLLLLSGSGNTPENFPDNLLRDWTFQDDLTFEKFRTGLYEITLQWKSPFKNIKTLLDCGDCFQLAIIRTGEFSGEFSDEFSDEFDIDGSTIAFDFIAISNCFKRACEDCFTSVLEYYNDDDYAEFRYCNVVNGLNRVRLPFYLLQPKMTEDKTVYRKSNGVVKQTKSLLTKEYQVLTEFFPEWLHDKFTVALAHDNVNVISGAYEGGISKSGEYVPDWSDNDCTAPASFKVLATPYAIRNNNCQDCQEIELCSPPVLPDFSLPDANVGEVYYYEVTLSGYQSQITNIVKPAWMTIALVGQSLYYSGTPEVEGAIDVSFDISNICTDAFTITKTLNIDNMVPGEMNLWGGAHNALPAGWLLCDGAAVSRTTYAALFAVCGSLHGPGDGSTTFNLPNTAKRFVAGIDIGDVEYNTAGLDGGSNSANISVGQLPKHRFKLFKEGDAVSLNDAWPAAPRAISRRNSAEGSNSEYRLDPASAGNADTGDSSEVGNNEALDIRNTFVVIPYKIKF